MRRIVLGLVVLMLVGCATPPDGQPVSGGEPGSAVGTKGKQITRERALEIAQGVDPKITWRADLSPSLEVESKETKLIRPVWILQSVSPAPNINLWIDAETEEILRVGQSEAPAPFPDSEDGKLLVDFNGDGRLERLDGLLDDWTKSELQVLDSEGAVVQRLTPGDWEHRIIPVQLLNPAVTVLLEWRRFPEGQTEVGIRALSLKDGVWEWQRLFGWGLKHAETTPATRAYLAPDGMLSVEWELGDPAGHARVRQYQLDLARSQVQIVAEELRPSGDQLRYPSAPEGVLQAAYVAAIHGLEAELPLYFASDAVMAAFKEAMPRAPYELSGLRLAEARILDQFCNFEEEQAQPNPDGRASFVLSIGGSPVLDVRMGTVTFGADQPGRPVIQNFEVTGRCPNR